jgi:hypothetical protein
MKINAKNLVLNNTWINHSEKKKKKKDLRLDIIRYLCNKNMISIIIFVEEQA